MGRHWQGSQSFDRAFKVARCIDLIAQRLLFVAQVTTLVGLAVVVHYAMDREPPLKLLSYDEGMQAKPGEYLKVHAKVWRDRTRDCDLHLSRFIFADNGRARYDVASYPVPDSVIDSMEKTTPGELHYALYIPESVEPGQAIIRTVLQYRCNKVHAIWPIIVVTEIPFTVTR